MQRHDPESTINAVHFSQKRLCELHHYFKRAGKRRVGKPIPRWAKSAICRARRSISMNHNNLLGAF